MSTRTLTLQQEGDFWRVIEISLPEGEIVPTPAPSPEQEARNTAAAFIHLLNNGRYQEAGAHFGGDLSPVLAQSPDVNGDSVNGAELRGQLLERFCTAGGGVYLAQRRIVHTELIADGPLVVWVEFNLPDGSLYQGADGTTALGLQVQYSNGVWLVLDLPPAV